AGFIREGAMAFLSREYRILAIFVVVVAVLLVIANWGSEHSHPLIAASFVLGAVCSGLAGYFGMKVATAANVRTTNAARTGLPQALQVAFSGGAVMGMSVVGLGVLGLGLLYVVYTHLGIFAPDGVSGQQAEFLEMAIVLQVLTGFSLGASSIALFAR